MNIANIFGLHFGCRIKFKQSSSDNYTGIGHLSAVKNGWVEISVDPDDTRLWYDCSDCKLLLKPLSKITDEDKAELEKQLDEYNCEIQLVGAIVSIISEGKEIVQLGVPNKTALWLASKGYNIGIVPDEYKEVEE